MSCGTLIAAPAASPLFHRAILMSGACSNCMTECDSLSLTTEFEHALKLPVGGLSVTSAGPQNISAARLLETQMKMFGIQGLMPFQPCVDGDLLPDSPLECVRAGSAIGKSIVVGCNASEWGLFHPLIPVLSSFTSRRAALTRVAGVLGPGKMDVLTPGGPDAAAQ